MDGDRVAGGQRGVRIAAEGLIIFAGVMAAFLVEGYRDDLQDRERRQFASPPRQDRRG